MQVFNSDETPVSIVHKPSKVVAELERHNVYSVTSAERGEPIQFYPVYLQLVFLARSLFLLIWEREAIPGTLFSNSESGWMNKEI